MLRYSGERKTEFKNRCYRPSRRARFDTKSALLGYSIVMLYWPDLVCFLGLYDMIFLKENSHLSLNQNVHLGLGYCITMHYNAKALQLMDT